MKLLRLAIVAIVLVVSAGAQTQYISICTFPSVVPQCKFVPLSTIQVPGPAGPQGPAGTVGAVGPQGPPGPPASYPGVTADGVGGLIITGKVTTKELDTSGPPPNGLTVGTTPGASGYLHFGSCTVAISGGVITGVTGC